jgi:hypothetical protein
MNDEGRTMNFAGGRFLVLRSEAVKKSRVVRFARERRSDARRGDEAMRGHR